MASGFVLGKSKILNVPRGYASGFSSPAALPEGHFDILYMKVLRHG